MMSQNKWPWFNNQVEVHNINLNSYKISQVQALLTSFMKSPFEKRWRERDGEEKGYQISVENLKSSNLFLP